MLSKVSSLNKNIFIDKVLIPKTLEKILPFLLIFLTFSLPLGPTLKSIFLLSAVFSILLLPNYRVSIGQCLKYPWIISILLLVVYAVIACFFSSASGDEKLLVLEKYAKFIFLPILIPGFMQKKTREMALNAYLAAMFLTCIISILKYYKLSFYHGADAGQVFNNYIMTGFMMALAFYISLIFAVKKSNKYLYIFLALLFSLQLIFINTGRTGYIIYITLGVLFVLQFLPLKKSLLGMILIGLLSIGIYYENAQVHARVNQILIDVKNYQQEKEDNSISYRLQFHNFAYKLFLQHPLIGNGTGSFTHAFATLKPVPSWDRRLLEPHSQYWLIASEFGIIGLALFSFFIVGLINFCWQLKDMREISFGVIIAFLLANITDSFLFYSGTGYLFIVMLAICISEKMMKADDFSCK